ncbi:MAG: hypothetical protein V1716_02580 [Candidatus Uhrbacteria bacterium]
MFLFLAAQDIKRMSAGLLDSEGRLLSFQNFETSPELYLFTISEFLRDHLASLESLEGLVVVSGPGSFTSTRIMVTIANALSFAKDLPIVGVENSARLSGEELIRDFGKDWVKKLSKKFISPVYDRPPNITVKVV